MSNQEEVGKNERRANGGDGRAHEAERGYDGNLVAAERRRIIDRVRTYAALRDQAAIMLDMAASGPGPEKPSEGGAERARAQAEVARDIARYLAEEANS